MDSGRQNRFWENITSFDFSEVISKNSVAILPVAAIEQHGPHLPVNVDSKIADSLVKILAEKLPAESKAIFLPTQRIGKSNEHLKYPGTLSLSAETMRVTLMELGKCVASSGVKKMMFLNSHGGNISVLDIVARDLRIEEKMLVFCVNWFGFGMPSDIYSESELRHGIHAGDMETSVMLALDPDNVKMDRAQNFVPKTVELESNFKYLGLNSGAKFGWQSQDLNAYGACGNALLSTAEKGNLTLEFASEKLLQVIKEIEAVPLDLLSEKTGR